jgi:hypothetical protein
MKRTLKSRWKDIEWSCFSKFEPRKFEGGYRHENGRWINYLHEEMHQVVIGPFRYCRIGDMASATFMGWGIWQNFKDEPAPPSQKEG